MFSFALQKMNRFDSDKGHKEQGNISSLKVDDSERTGFLEGICKVYHVDSLLLMKTKTQKLL